VNGWIVLAVYVLGFLFTYRRAYLALTQWEERSSPYLRVDTGDRAMLAVLGMTIASIWPVTLIGYAVWHFATPVTPGQRKQELDERERNIARMERELGISHDA
jgi:hypothetical protein